MFKVTINTIQISKVWVYRWKCGYNELSLFVFSCCLCIFIDIMIFFILYKLYILSTYTNPTPKPSYHTKLSALLHFQKITSYDLWGPKTVPQGQWFLDISIFEGTVCNHRIYQATHTHTHTHTAVDSNGSQCKKSV